MVQVSELERALTADSELQATIDHLETKVPLHVDLFVVQCVPHLEFTTSLWLSVCL